MIVSEVVFACHSRVCAPPPTGHGGSSPEGAAYRATRKAYAKMSPEARGRIDDRLKAKAAKRKAPDQSVEALMNEVLNAAKSGKVGRKQIKDAWTRHMG